MSSKAASKDPTALGYVVLISCIAATGGFLFGYDTAVINGTVGALERHFQADAGRLGFALLLIGSVGMTLTLGTMAWLFAGAPLDPHGSPVLSGIHRTAALVAANLYVFSFGFSWRPIVWVLLGEMFNNRIRGAALALAAAAQWVANWLVTLTSPGLSKIGLGLAYGLYTAAAALSFVLVWKFIRETKGRELEDM